MAQVLVEADVYHKDDAITTNESGKTPHFGYSNGGYEMSELFEAEAHDSASVDVSAPATAATAATATAASNNRPILKKYATVTAGVDPDVTPLAVAAAATAMAGVTGPTTGAAAGGAPTTEQQAALLSRSMLHTAANQISPSTKRGIQQLLKSNVGLLRQDATTVAFDIISSTAMQQEDNKRRFSNVALDIIREQEDRDIHPYGRGGRFEGILYARSVKIQIDNTRFIAWLVFFVMLLILSIAIIFLAELDRKTKEQALFHSEDSMITVNITNEYIVPPLAHG